MNGLDMLGAFSPSAFSAFMKTAEKSKTKKEPEKSSKASSSALTETKTSSSSPETSPPEEETSLVLPGAEKGSSALEFLKKEAFAGIPVWGVAVGGAGALAVVIAIVASVRGRAAHV